MKKKVSNTALLVIAIVGLLLLNAISNNFFTRFDLTQDKRYTLSEASETILEDVKSTVIVDVFLTGNFPPEFKRLEFETRQLLEEFAAKNKNIKFEFIDPVAENATKELVELGLTPTYITLEENGKVSQEMVFPWALANYGNKTVKVPLLKNNLGADSNENITISVQHLEYAFADAFTKLTLKEKKKIAILKGHGELDDIYIASFAQTLKDYYNIGAFDLKAFPDNPQKSLENLERFDLAIIAKPTTAFSDDEKYILDQFTVHGGKSIWLVETALAEMDSLYNDAGKSIAFPRDLRLNDYFFNYGIRVNPKLVNDLNSAPVIMAFGEGNNTQYIPIQWPYNPLAKATSKHPIVNNINLTKFEFANQIDTLKSSTKKTILLQSSPQSKLEGIPKEIALEIVEEELDPKTYIDKGNQNLAVLVEGTFTSAFKNRIKPFAIENSLDEGISKMIVIADGDVIKNQVSRGIPQELGFDNKSKRQYGNKEFLLNAVNYLLDDTGLINIRSKELQLAFLNSEKIIKEKTYWQLVNILFPLLLVGIFGFLFNFLRRKKYAS